VSLFFFPPLPKKDVAPVSWLVLGRRFAHCLMLWMYDVVHHSNTSTLGSLPPAYALYSDTAVRTVTPVAASPWCWGRRA